MSEEERAVVLLDKAECGRLSVEEMRWLERWLVRQEGRWPVQRLRARASRRSAPERVRERVLSALQSLKSTPTR